MLEPRQGSARRGVAAWRPPASALLVAVTACAGLAPFAALAPSSARADEPRRNVFGDPFVQATHAVAACPVPAGPLYTEAEARAQSHARAERGTTCYRSGRCRLPNAYLYDREIVPRVVLFIRGDGRFDASSIWVLGQRRWVYLQGCIASRELADALVQDVRLIDDVEAVIDELVVGP